MPRLTVRPEVRAVARQSRAARRFWSYCWGILATPRRTAEAIRSSATASEGITMTSIFGCLYALGAFTSYQVGRTPPGRTLKVIPAEQYYLWQSWFTLPMTLLQFTLNAVFARRLAKRAGGTGRFGADFTMLAFTQAMPVIAAMWLPDMLCVLLRPWRWGSPSRASGRNASGHAWRRIDERMYERLLSVYVPVATAWAVVLSAQGLAVSEQIRWRVALPTVLASELASAIASGVAVAMR